MGCKPILERHRKIVAALMLTLGINRPLHRQIRMLISIPIQTASQTDTLYHVEFFTLHRVGFRFQFKLPTTVMKSGLESNGSSPLLNYESDLDSDSDSKPYGYIVLCRTCFH